MGRRHDADIDRDYPRRPDRPHLAFLQDTQQLDLQRQRHIPNFIQEQRPLVRGDEQPLVILHRPGESTPAVTEQF